MVLNLLISKSLYIEKYKIYVSDCMTGDFFISRKCVHCGTRLEIKHDRKNSILMICPKCKDQFLYHKNRGDLDD